MIFPGTKERGHQAVVSRSYFRLFVSGFFSHQGGYNTCFSPDVRNLTQSP